MTEGGLSLQWALLISLILHLGCFFPTYLDVTREGFGSETRLNVRLAASETSKDLNIIATPPEVVPEEGDALLAQDGEGKPKQQREYIPSKELSIKPSTLEPVVVPFPDGGEPLAGYVKLQILLSERGEVDSITVIASDLPEKFSEIAMETFMDAHFSPGYLNGEAVPTKLKIQIDFVSARSR